MRTATCATISWNSSRRLYSRSAGKIISAHPEYIEANFMVALPLPDLPPEISALRILALDLRWTWSHEADALWERVDARLWRRTRNPWSVLQSASARRLQRLAADAAFRKQLAGFMAARQEYLERPGWFVANYGRAALTRVAYLSMEFGL